GPQPAYSPAARFAAPVRSSSWRHMGVATTFRGSMSKVDALSLGTFIRSVRWGQCSCTLFSFAFLFPFFLETWLTEGVPGQENALARLPVAHSALFNSYESSPDEEAECLSGTRSGVLDRIQEWA